MVAAALAIYSHRLIPLLASGFDPDTLALTVRLFRLLIPTILLIGVSRLWAGALNAHGRFLIVALAPIFSPLLSLLSVLFLRGPLGITALAYGFVGGAGAEVVLLGALLRASQLPSS